MANQERGEFTIAVGDRRFTLRVTTNACAELEDFANGRTWDQVLVGCARGSVKDVRLLLWAALRDKHPDVATNDPESVKAIGRLVDDAGGFAGMQAQMFAFIGLNQAPPEPKGGESGEGSSDPPTAQAEVAGVGSALTPASSV